jgi:hypothetical protein
MFFLSLPRSVKIGSTVECRINGEPKQVTYRDTNTLVIEPNDAPSIVAVRDDSQLRHFICADADGVTDFVII